MCPNQQVVCEGIEKIVFEPKMFHVQIVNKDLNDLKNALCATRA